MLISTKCRVPTSIVGESLKLLAVGSFAIFTALQSANAATATAPINVTANIAAVCTITATPIPFGAYTGAGKQQQGTITVTCPTGTSYTVGIDGGTNYSNVGTSASWGGRNMKHTTATSLLAYLLSWTNVTAMGPTYWGLSPTNLPSAVIGNASAQPMTVYGYLPPSQTGIPGAYSDTASAVVTF